MFILNTIHVVMIPATLNQTSDHLIAAANYSQMLYQLSYSRLDHIDISEFGRSTLPLAQEVAGRAVEVVTKIII